MILHFSSTGNCKYAAAELEKADELLPGIIEDIVQRKRVRVKGEWPAPMLMMMKRHINRRAGRRVSPSMTNAWGAAGARPNVPWGPLP